MRDFKVDKKVFKRRTKKLYASWKEAGEGDPLNQVDAIVVAVGSKNTAYSKSISVQTWLFGYELPDTIMAFCKSSIIVLSSKKKINFVQQVEGSSKDGSIPPFNLLVRDKRDKDTSNIQTFIEAIKVSSQSQRKRVKLGVVSEEKVTGEFLDSWKEAVVRMAIEEVDISAAIAMMMAPKEDIELYLVKKACDATMDLYKKCIRKELRQFIKNSKKIKHSKLANRFEKESQNKKHYTAEKMGELNMERLEVYYHPIIQSGGAYKLQFSEELGDGILHFGSIACLLGLRYKAYCSNVARMLMVDPTQEMKDNYALLLKAQDEAIAALRHGTKLSVVYEAAVKVIKAAKPELVEKTTENAGFGMGLVFQEESLVISPESDVVAVKGMVFNLNLGFSDLVNKFAKDEEGKIYSLFIGDTVLVNDMYTPGTILTSEERQTEHATINLDDEEEEEEEEDEEEEEEDEEEEEEDGEQSKGRSQRSVLVPNRTRMQMPAEKKRQEHQKKLAEKIQREGLERCAVQGEKEEEKKKVSISYYALVPNRTRTEMTAEEKRQEHQKKLAEKIQREGLERCAVQGEKEDAKKKASISYKTEIDIPDNTAFDLFVDKKHETVLVPWNGKQVPFHITTIKNVSQSIEGDHTCLRINFFPKDNEKCLKEMVLRGSNSQKPGQVMSAALMLKVAYHHIKEVQEKFKSREPEEREKEGIMKQDSLIISPSARSLDNLCIRPNIHSESISGLLEAHKNGLRFTSVRKDRVDILYNNIKTAFFQPLDEDLILVHFHLKNAILFGKREHIDVQFYLSIEEVFTDFVKRHNLRGTSEEQEKKVRCTLNTWFVKFCDEVSAKGDIKFEVPVRYLGFQGATNRSTVLIQPTDGCLINLTEWPPFVVTLKEVEVVHFERVQLKRFDMVFVFKDYHKKVVMITAVPMTNLDNIKEWLNKCDIKYSEGIQSLNWTKIMKTITDDPAKFFNDGGWKFLDPESDEENEDDDHKQKNASCDKKSSLTGKHQERDRKMKIE